MRNFVCLCLLVSLVSVAAWADGLSRYEEIAKQIEELGFSWVPARLPDVDQSRVEESWQEMGLLWEDLSLKGEPLGKLPDTRDLPAKFSWLEYDPATGPLPELPPGKYVSNCNYQLKCGSCWAFGALHAFEAVYRIAHKNPATPIDMSPQILVSCSPNWGCNGGWLSNTSNFLRDNGTWDEKCYPYLAQNAPCGDACSQYPEKTYKVTSWRYVDGGITVENLKKALYHYGPVYTSMNVYDDFRYYYVGGVYQVTPSAKSLGGHAVAIVGYDDGEQCFIVQNSWDRLRWEEEPPKPWGEEFKGDRGYFRIHYNQLSSKVSFARESIVYTYQPAQK